MLTSKSLSRSGSPPPIRESLYPTGLLNSGRNTAGDIFSAKLHIIALRLAGLFLVLRPGMDSKHSLYGKNGVLCEPLQEEALKRVTRWTRGTVENQPVATRY